MLADAVVQRVAAWARFGDQVSMKQLVHGVLDRVVRLVKRGGEHGDGAVRAGMVGQQPVELPGAWRLLVVDHGQQVSQAWTADGQRGGGAAGKGGGEVGGTGAPVRREVRAGQ